ncbi:type IV pilin [Halomarina litorea]|uniref:type IV pilin n=1 Tax=Halomarina litorea TaxID=2961595 RepID=UPI0020C29D7C|nr:type IV pilin [Halomarina sp. BCD28]
MSRPSPTAAPDAGDRASAPLASVLLVALVVLLAAGVGTTTLAVEPPDPPPAAAFDVDADASGRIAVTYLAGDPLPVEDLSVRVRVDGSPIAHQPPVPFFAARGFESGPTGPFNSAWGGSWEPGATGAFSIAGTNTPLSEGSVVEVRIVVDGSVVATSEVRV